MAIYKFTKDALQPLTETELSVENILERKDLQRILRNQIQVLDSELMVVSEEFDQWVESSRRIDLLCIDKQANLVVVELKRTEDGGYMELQAIRYAAMISALTFAQLVDTHKRYLEKTGKNPSEAEQALLSFLEWDEPDDDRFANAVRIVLASAIVAPIVALTTTTEGRERGDDFVMSKTTTGTNFEIGQPPLR
jgi:hypothetical protein